VAQKTPQRTSPPQTVYTYTEELDPTSGLYRYRKIPVSSEKVDGERSARTYLQKTAYGEFAKVPMGALQLQAPPPASPPPDPSIHQVPQSRTIEVAYADSFDGLFADHQLQIPHVEPMALVRITNDYGLFSPIIEAMANNVDGPGWMFYKTVDFKNPEDRKMIQEHLEGDLLQRLETDGIARLFKMFDGDPKQRELLLKSYEVEADRSSPTHFRDFVHPTGSDYQRFLEVAVDSLPILKSQHDPKPLSEAELWPSVRLWKSRHGLRAFVESEARWFTKIRTRETAAAIRRMEREQSDELKMLKSFFDNAHPLYDFTVLRKRFRIDREKIGAGAFEIIRDPRSRMPIQIEHVVAASLRMTLRGDAIRARMPLRINAIEIVETDRPMRFRRFAQFTSSGMTFIWFKEFGDPRILDSMTGKFVGEYRWNRQTDEYDRVFYDDEVRPTLSEERYLAQHPDFKEGNEILWDAMYSGNGATYPYPRWFGYRDGIQGMIAMETVNASLFDNNMVPPYFILVSGGKLGQQSKQMIENTLEKKRGREKFFGVIILEAENQARQRMFGATGTPTIDIKSMQADRQTDATHDKYDKSGQEKFRAIWRFAKAIMGQEPNLNRNTGAAAIILSEVFVFRPERDDFDKMVDKTLMPALRVNFWRFRTKTPAPPDNKEMAEILVNLAKVGLSPVGELQPEVEAILGRQLKKRSEDINTKPLPLVLIEAKLNAVQQQMAQKGPPTGQPSDGKKGPRLRSDTSAENPEDKFFGVRPEKQGLLFESTVVKSADPLWKAIQEDFDREMREVYVAKDFEGALDLVEKILAGGEDNVVAVGLEDDYIYCVADPEKVALGALREAAKS